MPGVVRLNGDFKKGDILLINDEDGVTLGVGRASMDKDKAEKTNDETHSKPLIHYDYLYIYPENQ